MQQLRTQNKYTYLALGDSYTIGESLALQESFPYQTVQLLRAASIWVQAPEIIAKTGWTTNELHTALLQTQLLPTYDIVSLLIGVNNQYRGRTIENYSVEFEQLLQQAIGYAGNQPTRVAVMSIPDWGITPFAADRDSAAISLEIDGYNQAAKKIAQNLGVYCIDITTGSRESATNHSLLASDRLHPSAKEYARWAKQLASFFEKQLTT